MAGAAEILEALERQTRRSLSLWRRLTAAQLLVGSFLGLVLLGTLLLLFLPGLYVGERLSFVDALFTATSAVCVTGLVVADTATFFTPAGQVVVLLLIQLGGLGILTFTTLLILVIGRRISLRGEALVGGVEAVTHIEPGQLVRSIFRYTVLIEAAGALALWIAWVPAIGPIRSIWPAIFHAVSAFCNAGYTVFRGGLTPFAADPATQAILSMLVVLGGLGFLVLEELRLLATRSPRPRLSLHARLVLVTTAALIALGATLFSLFEWNNALSPFPWYVRPFHAVFLSVMPRSGGFNILDYSELTSASLFLTLLLMTIGGSPGSTAGGIKTTTVALLVALAVARLRGRLSADAFGRTIPESTIQRAIGLVVLAIALTAAAILLLQLTELGGVPHSAAPERFWALTFEAVSAFNIVGLSMGITADLTQAGKLLLIVLMFVGRVGPFTLVASMALAAARRTLHLRYATEDVVVG
ncbi:MAG TPA: potassium transporter TrkG [Longimicrobiales bacterium]